jgi:glycerol-1-phosphatase
MGTPGGDGTPVVCCDLDGVFWRGDEPIPGSADAFAHLRTAGLRVGFVTNNSNLRVADYLQKLERFGIEVEADALVTSAQAAAALLARQLAPGAKVLACAGPGVVEALQAAGLEAVVDDHVEAVVVGWHRDFDYDAMTRASSAVRSGARFVATNLDATYPVPCGVIPGAGAIVAAVATAAGQTPEVAGKPAAPMADLVRRRFGSSGLVVGDRPSTDGAFAATIGWPFALVLSGVASATPGPADEAIPVPAPPFVGENLAGLVPRIIEALTG